MVQFKPLSGSPSKGQGTEFQSIFAPLENYIPPEACKDTAELLTAQLTSSHLPLLKGQPVEAAADDPKSNGCCKRFPRNKPQTNSLAAATLICISGGISLRSSFGFGNVSEDLSTVAPLYVRICWFVAVIVGAYISAILIKITPMRVFNTLASILVMINGILLNIDPVNAGAVMFGRCCDGIAFGLIVIPAIVVSSERSVIRFRGAILSFEQFGLGVGMSLYADNSITHGIMALIVGALALACTFIYNMESPISYLRKGDEAGAILALKCQEKDAQTLLNENKCLLEEDCARGRTANILIGLMPMAKLCVYRALVVMSFSLPILFALRMANDLDSFGMISGFAVMRLIGAILAVYTVDGVGRKGVSAVSLLFSGALLLAIATLFTPYGKYLSYSKDMAKALLFIYHVLAGAAAPASTCYLGEAFSISVKSYFILVTIIFENIIQILVFWLISAEVSNEALFLYLLPLATLLMLFAIFSSFGMPETSCTTLREALAKFANEKTPVYHT